MMRGIDGDIRPDNSVAAPDSVEDDFPVDLFFLSSPPPQTPASVVPPTMNNEVFLYCDNLFSDVFLLVNRYLIIPLHVPLPNKNCLSPLPQLNK